MSQTSDFRSMRLNIKGKVIEYTRPLVMGIVNLTPDSFYDGGRYDAPSQALHHAETLIKQGADWLDIGGYSTRPQATEISVNEELQRVIPFISLLNREFPQVVISVDTFRAEVAKVAVENGADIVNDISGGRLDAEMLATVGRLGVPYIMMHSRGTPQTMTQLTDYDNIISEIMDFFNHQKAIFYQAGGKDLILDIGFGFAKTLEQNHFLLKNLELFHIFGQPLLVGISRKSMIYKKLNISPQEALNGTTALNTFALTKGAAILRVHDVKEAKEIIELLY